MKIIWNKTKKYHWILMLFSVTTPVFGFEGTTQINISDEKNINLLIPLMQDDNYTLFTQGGLADGTYNIGFGHRTELNDILLGLNSFYTFDEDNHKRLSIGLEGSTESLQFNYNQYLGLDDWRIEGDYQTKTASGFDVQLMSNPFDQDYIFGKVSYSKFSGNDEEFKIGTRIQPIPLLSFDLDYDVNNDDVTGYISLTYRFGETLADQVDPGNVNKFNSLKGHRLEPVNFNRNLVQEKKLSINQPPLINNVLPRISLQSSNDLVGVNDLITLEAKVYKIIDDEIVLLDEIVVKFKSEDLTIGLATTSNGIASIDFSAKTAGEYRVFSIADEIISNSIYLTFIESQYNLEQPKEETPVEEPKEETPLEEPKEETPVEAACINETITPIPPVITPNNFDGPRIDSPSISGIFAEGQVLTVNYTFVGINNPFDPNTRINTSIYEYGPYGTTSLDFFSSPFVPNNVYGLNSFKLPPLTYEQSQQVMEVQILPLDGLGRGGEPVILNTSALPCN